MSRIPSHVENIHNFEDVKRALRAMNESHAEDIRKMRSDFESFKRMSIGSSGGNGGLTMDNQNVIENRAQALALPPDENKPHVHRRP